MQIATRKRRPGFLQTFWGQSTEGGPKSKYAALSVPRGCFFLRWKLPWCRLLGLHEEWKFQGALQGIWLRVRDQLNILRRKCFRSMSLSFQSSHRAVDAHSGFSSIYLQSRDLWGFYSSCGCVVCCCQLNNYDVGNCRTWMDGLTGLHRWGGQNEAIVVPTFSWHPKYLWTPAVPSASAWYNHFSVDKVGPVHWTAILRYTGVQLQSQETQCISSTFDFETFFWILSFPSDRCFLVCSSRASAGWWYKIVQDGSA